MAKQAPWALLQKLADNKADSLARELAAIRREAQRLGAQRDGLSAALTHYAPAPEQGLPISLLRNQLAFRQKLADTLKNLEVQIVKNQGDLDAAIQAWQAAKAKADAYDKLRLADRAERRDRADKAEAKITEESALLSLSLRKKEEGDSQ